jgi:hypothetical protein
MKLVVLLVFAPLAFCQAVPEVHLLDRLNPPQNSVMERFKSMKLIVPEKPVRVIRVAKACAIPPEQALPKNDKTDYKMRIVKPGGMEVAAIGADPCPM